jgi:tetratricopeptide (TPR) repeat protein
VPHARNPFFTGREAILETLHERLAGERAVALTQSYALHGLGGVGKTQLAVEYCYRYSSAYASVFWIGAEHEESIFSSFAAIAELVQVRERQEADTQKMVAAVRRWLATHQQWLLVWDNVEDLGLVQRFLPDRRQGAILITTRRRAVGILAEGIELPTLSPEEGVQFLLRRAKLLRPQSTPAQAGLLAQTMPAEYQAAEQLAAEMGGLPLALDQAGAYIEETPCSVAAYLELFQTRRWQLLERRGEAASEHPDSVVATWSCSFEQVEQANPLAADLLCLCACLAPDAIPEELLIQHTRSGAEEPEAADQLRVHAALRTLSAYSLLWHEVVERTCSMHRLAQAVLRENLGEHRAQQWVERAVDLLEWIFPEEEYGTWGHCERLVPHVLACANHPLLGGHLHLEFAALLHKAACYLSARGQRGQAEPLFQRALYIREQVYGSDHLDVATSLHHLARLYRGQGRFAEAETLLQRALRIREDRLGPQHLDVGHLLNDLGILYNEQGKYAEAEPLYLRALQIYEHQVGPEHPWVALHGLSGGLISLAELYSQQGRYIEAEPLFQRALHILEQQVGPEHPHIGYLLDGLADLYSEQGKYAEAELLYLRGLHILEQQVGPEHPHVGHLLGGLAAVCLAQSKYTEAELLYQRSLHILEQQWGPEHLYVAPVLNGLAKLALAQHKYAEAETLYQHALHILDQAVGEEHPETAETMHDLGRLREAQGKREEARAWYERALSIREQALGVKHPKSRLTRQRLIALLQTLGLPEQVAHLEAAQAEP